jgi:predicted deacylase
VTIKTVNFHALTEGPTLTVLGAVHGNERCGAQAIVRLIAAIESGVAELSLGTLQLVPVTNPEAYAKGVRFVERNLNRHLYPKPATERRHYEDFLDPVVCTVLDRTDVLLDLHSYTSPGGPFIFLGPHQPREMEFARALGISDFVCGWTEAYSSGGLESQGTTEYARSMGAIAATLECGQHANADAADIGYEAILRALAHLGMLAPECAAAQSLAASDEAGERRCVRMKSVYYRERGGLFVIPWRHFDAVSAGEPIAELAGGGRLLAPEDGFIVLPHADAPEGSEWFYFGTATVFPE